MQILTNSKRFVRQVGLAVCSVLIIGCSSVRVNTQESASPPESTLPAAERAAYDLVLLDLDFTPALATLDWTTYSEATLLVAVANEGQEAVEQVRVIARLVAESSTGQSPLRIESVQTLASLEVGEVRVLHFKPLERLPMRPRYRLEVTVEGVNGEENTDNNQRWVDITIGTGK